MTRPRLLDLFCGAGGCGKGYKLAGFDVVGVDHVDQPDYPAEFRLGDALEVAAWLANGDHDFDAVHASPPCPRYSLVSGFQGVAEDHPDLVGTVRDLLDATPLPYVIENVPGAPVRPDLKLCGEMFGLRVHRHRLFELRGFFAMSPPHARHNLRGGKTNCETGPGIARWITGNYADHADAADAMGIAWPMSRRGLANAVPPAYTAHIGAYLIEEVRARQQAAA